MRSTFKLLFYINRKKVRADGMTAVLCRISIDGRNAVIATGVHCRPGQWNMTKGQATDPGDNRRLSELRGHITKSYEHILKEQGVISAEILKNTLAGINTYPGYLLRAGQEEIERLRVKSVHSGSDSTYRLSGIIHRKLRDFILFRGTEDILLSSVTEEFAESFKTFCKKELGHSTSYVNRCLCWLNRLIYIAVDQEVLRANPIEEVEYEKTTPSKPGYISRNELKRIMETPMFSPRRELARRVFIFSCFTGMAYADVYGLMPGHIGHTVEGKAYIRKSRTKTSIEAFIPLHPVALQILSLYNTTDDGLPVFPLPRRELIRVEIKHIGFGVGVREDLSYHTARHSFGTLCLSGGMPIESISKMMGHSDISSTQIYAKVTNRKISEDMDRLIERRDRQQQEKVTAGGSGQSI